MEVFFGEYNQVLDGKNRMRMPMKLKVLLGNEYYILNGAGGCLIVMKADRFNEMTAQFARVPMSDTAARSVVSEIMASVVVPEEDAQGRFVLPAHSVKYAEIDKNIVIVGACDLIEIWSEENYRARRSSANYNESLADKLTKLREYGI